MAQRDPALENTQANGRVWSFNPSTNPPPFGHPLKQYFGFEEKYVNLNNGSYGSLPLPVFSECSKLQLEAEANPDRFHRITSRRLLIESRRLLAELVGAELDEIVLVPNATSGVNTVLRNFEWTEGDILFGASTTYGAVLKTLHYLGDRSEAPRPKVETVQYTFPMSHSDIIDATRAKIRELKQANPDSEFTDVPPGSLAPGDGTVPAGKKNKFVAVIDSIVSNPGALLPWKEIVRICREEGVWSIIDGAHSIGQEVGINLSEARPDFWVSNCHKWMYAKRGCAVFYVPKRNQYIIKSSIPTSHGYILASDPRSAETTHFVDQHEWTGTLDFTPYLSIKHALAFRQWLGGEEAINTYCHNLAVAGGKRLAEILGTRVMDETGEITLNMTNVQLPLPVLVPGEEPIYNIELGTKIYGAIQHKLLDEWNAYVAFFFHGGAWWCRCSAQVWNEITDFEYIGKALNEICKEIRDTFLQGRSLATPEAELAARHKIQKL